MGDVRMERGGDADAGARRSGFSGPFAEGDVPGVGLRATWVDVAPGARQRLHDHDAELARVVLEGRGRVQIGDAEQ